MSTVLEHLWQYLTIFVMAAIPWLEILVVIPIGLGMGLNPIALGIVAFLGNILPIYGIVMGYERFRLWRRRRKGDPENVDDELATSGGRGQRALNLFRDYGMVGLALASPILTGVHLATVIAMAARAPAGRIIFWMTMSLIIWTAILTAAFYFGLDFIIGWFS